MCYDFSPYILAADGSQPAAVEAVGVSSFNVGLSSFRVEGGDTFDQRSVEFMFQDDNIPNLESLQKEGESGKHHKVPFLKIGQHGVADDFVDTKHNEKPCEGNPSGLTFRTDLHKVSLI